MPLHIVMTSRAKMPGSCPYAYTRVAVVELDHHYTAYGLKPKFISERARGVRRVIDLGKYPSNGATMKSGLQQALARAEELAAKLNSGKDQK